MGSAGRQKRLRLIAQRLARLPPGPWLQQGTRVLWREGEEWSELGSFLSEWPAEFLVQARIDVRWLLLELGCKTEGAVQHLTQRTRLLLARDARRSLPPLKCECDDMAELFCCRCGQSLCARHVKWLPFADNPPAPRCSDGVGCSD